MGETPSNGPGALRTCAQCTRRATHCAHCVAHTPLLAHKLRPGHASAHSRRIEIGAWPSAVSPLTQQWAPWHMRRVTRTRQHVRAGCRNLVGAQSATSMNTLPSRVGARAQHRHAPLMRAPHTTSTGARPVQSARGKIRIHPPSKVPRVPTPGWDMRPRVRCAMSWHQPVIRLCCIIRSHRCLQAPVRGASRPYAVPPCTPIPRWLCVCRRRDSVG